MADVSNISDKAHQEMVRRLSWRRQRIHHLGGRLLNMNELEVRLEERAEARRRIAICAFLSGHGVPNTARAHRAAIKRLWADIEHRFGPAPDPQTLVAWRNEVGGSAPPAQSAPVRRRNGGAR